MNAAGDDAADLPWVWGVAGVIETTCTGRSVLLHPGFVFASKFEWPTGRFDPDSSVSNDYLARLPASCRSTIPRDFDASPADLALVARNSLFVNDGVEVYASTGHASVGNQGRAQTVIGSRAVVGSIWSDAPVTLRSYAIVRGSVQSSSTITTQAGATSGTQSPNTVPVFRSLPRLDNVRFPPLGVDVALEPDVERSLPPGAYGDVRMKAHSVLVLTTGTYYFRSLFLEPQSSLSVDDARGPVRVLILNALTFRGQTVRRTGFGVPALLLFIDGTGGAVIDSSFQGSVVAPRGPVSIASAPSHTGSFLGKDVVVHQWTSIYHMAFPAEWLPDTVSCTDGFFNGTETAIDCGGTCQPCAP
jgi:hypothetical protein